MINMILWKSLPYEIKLVLYTAVLTSHTNQRKHYLTYSKVLNDITELHLNANVQRDEIQKYLQTKDEGRFSFRYEEQELVSKLKYLYFDDDCLSFTYFLRNVFEKLKEYDKKNLRINRYFSHLDQPFKIHFNCTKIRDLYGPSVFIYYLNEGGWNRFLHPLPYGSYLPIRQRDIERYNNILISHIDFGNYMLDPVSIQEAISNPIFKFSIYDLEDNRFVFNGINKKFQKYFIKESQIYKGFNYKTNAYKHIFTANYLKFPCAFRSDFIRYNYLFNKLVFKDYYVSKYRLENYRYTNLDYKNLKKTIRCLNEDILLKKKSGSRRTYHEKEYYKTLWFIADEEITRIMEDYNITNLSTVLY